MTGACALGCSSCCQAYEGILASSQSTWSWQVGQWLSVNLKLTSWPVTPSDTESLTSLVTVEICWLRNVFCLEQLVMITYQCTRLCHSKVVLAWANVFQVQQDAPQSCLRKQPASCKATKRIIKMFIVQTLFRPVHTAQSGHHEGKGVIAQ